MRISYRIATVGGIPVGIAALIAVFAWTLLEQAGRSREAAVLDATAFSDARGMAEQEARLLDLTEQARKRQHAANVALVASLTEADRRLRASRAVVDGLHALREATLYARLAARDVAALPLHLDRVDRVTESLAEALAWASGVEGEGGARFVVRLPTATHEKDRA